MKHIKKFEELDNSTYLSAANKLKSKGHINRSKELEEYAKRNEIKNNFTIIENDKVYQNIEISEIKIVEKIISEQKEKGKNIIQKILKYTDQYETVDTEIEYRLEVSLRGEDFSRKFKHVISTEPIEKSIKEFFGGGGYDVYGDHGFYIKFTPIFIDRKQAKIFVDICNDYITKNHDGESIKLVVNDFYEN